MRKLCADWMPTLVGMLQEFDNVTCGSKVNTDPVDDLTSHTAVDVRLLFVGMEYCQSDKSEGWREKTEAIAAAGGNPYQLPGIQDFVSDGVACPAALLPSIRLQNNKRARKSIITFWLKVVDRASMKTKRGGRVK